jgi:hypothetical protein
MIHAQPQCPRVVVKSQRKNNRHHKQNCENRRIAKVSKCETRQVGEEDKGFSGDDIRHDGADKETFLTFEDSPTFIAFVF